LHRVGAQSSVSGLLGDGTLLLSKEWHKQQRARCDRDAEPGRACLSPSK
jgi:hypothetical protein